MPDPHPKVGWVPAHVRVQQQKMGETQLVLAITMILQILGFFVVPALHVAP